MFARTRILVNFSQVGMLHVGVALLPQAGWFIASFRRRERRHEEIVGKEVLVRRLVSRPAERVMRRGEGAVGAGGQRSRCDTVVLVWVLRDRCKVCRCWPVSERFSLRACCAGTSSQTASRRCRFDRSLPPGKILWVCLSAVGYAR